MTIHKLKNITYDLVKMEKALVFQILEQDESWTFKGDKNKLSFQTTKGVNIISENYPSLEYLRTKNESTIYLRGVWKGYDYYLLDLFFHSGNITRNCLYSKINQALKEWDNHVEQLKNKEKK